MRSCSTRANHANGYTLTSVVVNSEDVEDDDFDVEVCEEDGTSDEFPSTTASDCTALTAPGSFVGVGNVHVHAHRPRPLGEHQLRGGDQAARHRERGRSTPPPPAEKMRPASRTGASKTNFYWKSGSTWMLKSGSNEALSIVVYGVLGDTSDVTLSALSVSGATLSPAFNAATTTYSAVVANAVSQVTITQTTSETTATVEYLDGSDATLTDADTMTAGLQVNLSVGSNIVKVKVTAPDTTTTQTYTIDVVRGAVPATCSAASMQNQVWTGNLTVGTRMIFSQTVYGWDGQNRYTGASLSDDEFSFGGDTYAFDEIYIAGPTLSIAFEAGNAGDIATQATRNGLVLHIGNDSFNLGAGTLASSQRAISWSSNVPTWAASDGVCLALTVDGPDVSSVALTSTPGADNTYAISDAVEATVTFDAAVDITGTPELELDFAGTAKLAACATATNTTTMACSYTVAVGDSAPNGIAIGANKLTGGAITATGSTTISADLTHSLVSIDDDHKVDGIRPTLVTTGPDAPTTSTDGETVLLVFSEDIGAVSHSDITIQANSVTVSTSAASVTATKVELTLTTALTATATNLTVALAADAVEDNAENGNLALAATGVTNAYVPTPPGRPAAPSVSSVSGSTTSLEVTWTAPSNTGPAIDDYDLQYRQGTSGNFTAGPQDQTGTTATITGLTANTLYQVQVRATNSDGDGPWSPPGSGQTNTAGNSAPTFANPTETRSVAENSPADTDVGAAVTATDGDNDPLAYSLDGNDAASFTIVTTSGQIRTRSGVTYDYETKSSYTVIVKADDNNGGTDTVTVTIDLTDINEPPGMVVSRSVPMTTSDGTITLSVTWTPPPNTGPAIESYDLQYREAGTNDWFAGPQNVTGSSTTITDLPAGTTYQVQVRANNADGPGAWLSSRPPSTGGGDDGPRKTAPDAPRNLTAEATEGAVTLSWEAPRDDGGAAIRRYEYEQNGSGAWTSTGGTATSYTVRGLTSGETYTFRVRAVNRIGRSGASNRAEATLPVVLDFAHFANGTGITSAFMFVNVSPHMTQPALYFYDQEGALIDPESVVDVTVDMEVTEDGSLTVLTAMEPLGELTIRTHGRDELLSGSVKVVSGGPLGGGVRYSVPGVGVAGVGTSPPVWDVLFPARRREGGIRTAAALHNLGEEAMGVNCRLLSGGVALEEVEIALQANGQTSWYIEEAFPATDTSDFLGSVRCTASGGRFTAIAVETDAVQRTFTTLPVAPVDYRGGGDGETVLDFAHFANGTWITDLVFLNLSAQASGPPLTPFHAPILPSRPVIYFYDTEGALLPPASVVDLTDDLEVTADGALTLSSEMEPLGVFTISTHGRGELLTGSVRVVSEGPIGGMLRFDHPSLGVAGVAAGRPVSDVIFPVQRQEGGINTGVALHNLQSSPGLLRCELMKEGVLLDSVSISLETNGQTSWAVDQAFPTTDTSDFLGTVRCSATGGDLFTAVALEMDSGNRTFTALPVAPVQEMPSQE